MLRPKAVDAREVQRAARADRMRIRCAEGSAPGEFLSIYIAFYPFNSEPTSAERVFGPAWRAFPIEIIPNTLRGGSESY